MIGYFRAFTWLTYMNGAAGVLGIFFAAHGRLSLAVICLIIAGVCDMFDGTVARKMERSDAEKVYGMQIDSFSDLVSFGVLPAALGLAMGESQGWGFLICIIYIMAALIRLAYFNVTEIENFYAEGERRVYYEGLPVTSAAAIIPLAYLLCAAMQIEILPVYRIMLLVMAILFVSRIRVRKPGIRQMALMGALGVPAIFLIIRFMIFR